MSIVYEYLKQIQRQKGPPQVLAEKTGSQDKKKTRWPRIAVGAMALAGVLLAALGTIYWIAAREPGGAGQGVPLLHEPVKTRSVSPVSGYVLEGIIYNPDQPFAIINGKMIEREGRIDDLIVTVISPDSVSLKNTQDGTERTLYL